MLYNIYAGLGGGFGGATFIETREFESEYEASKYAYLEARDIYESYGGMYGLFDPEEAWESPDLYGFEEMTEDIINDLYEEDLESWIDYYVVPTAEEDEIGL